MLHNIQKMIEIRQKVLFLLENITFFEKILKKITKSTLQIKKGVLYY